MSADMATILTKLEVLGTTLAHVKQTGDETRDQVKQQAVEHKKDMQLFEERMRKVEDKAQTIKGVWLAIVITSTLLGVAGTIVGILVGVTRLGGHG